MSEATTFEQGQVVYTLDGERVEFMALVDGEGFVVRHLSSFDEGGGEYFNGRISVEEKLFAEEQGPRDAISKEISILRTELESWQQRLRNASRELNAAKDREREMLTSMARVKGLEHLEAFIEGRITHFVAEKYGQLLIQTWEETMHLTGDDRDDRWSKLPQLKLVTLFGRTKGDLTWRIHRYSDGSGNSTYDVIPCMSLEEARTKAQTILEDAWARERAEEKGFYWTRSFADSARKLGFPVPEDIAAKVLAAKRIDADLNVDKAKKTLAEYQAVVAKLEAEAIVEGSNSHEA